MKFLKICPSYAELSPANVNKPRDNAPLQKGNQGDRKFNDNEPVFSGCLTRILKTCTHSLTITQKI